MYFAPSKVVGYLFPDNKIFELLTTENEKFYIGTIRIENEDYPIVYSEHNVHKEGMYETECFLRNTKINGRMFTYIYAGMFREVPADTPSSSTINVSGIVWRTSEIKFRKRDLFEVLNFTVSTRIEKEYQILHCGAIGEKARQLSTLKKSEYISVTGKLRKHKDSFSVEVQEVKLRKEGNSNVANRL